MIEFCSQQTASRRLADWMLFVMCLRTSFLKHFMRIGVTLDSAGGTMVAVLKQVGTISCDNKMFKMPLYVMFCFFFSFLDQQAVGPTQCFTN